MSHQQVLDSLRDRGLEALEAGRMDEALAVLHQAYDLARDVEDETRIDRAFCNLAAVEIELRRFSEVQRLREILVKNGDAENCRLAAYNIARYYQFTKDYKKALFYARLALDRSRLLERNDWIASARNRIGNILLGESYFQEARAEYEQALSMMSSERSVARAAILDNLGYCRVIQGDFVAGFRDLITSLRTLRALGARGYERGPRLSLCFAFLEVGRYRNAAHHGVRALEIAESVGDEDTIKNALYLLGEAANLEGDSSAARDHFARLQERFYPSDRHLPDFLLAIDVRKLVNLKA
jgi:tetratricopeptide (TPR) repeat protein